MDKQALLSEDNVEAAVASLQGGAEYEIGAKADGIAADQATILAIFIQHKMEHGREDAPLSPARRAKIADLQKRIEERERGIAEHQAYLEELGRAVDDWRNLSDLVLNYRP